MRELWRLEPGNCGTSNAINHPPLELLKLDIYMYIYISLSHIYIHIFCTHTHCYLRWCLPMPPKWLITGLGVLAARWFTTLRLVGKLLMRQTQWCQGYGGNWWKVKEGWFGCWRFSTYHPPKQHRPCHFSLEDYLFTYDSQGQRVGGRMVPWYFH